MFLDQCATRIAQKVYVIPFEGKPLPPIISQVKLGCIVLLYVGIVPPRASIFLSPLTSRSKPMQGRDIWPRFPEYPIAEAACRM
ncbi:hypothetical protein GDO81_020579 [Engystomops pustulosus]|uniref:Uncharacterized protein n=1 Tax=Engystomops pustulosus TaxID=76066 RepID=A0AAV6YX23_ENGPU|nr:hypothetical protein GDO81_020579 [Engystomops pustulosus]